MRLETIHIEEFSPQEEYGEQRFETNGETTLIHGPNRSGKTLTFCAIGYAMLQESWGARTGRGAKVHADFTPRGKYTASSGGHQLELDGQEYSTDDAEGRLVDLLGPKRFTRHFFLHSQVSQLPLERASGSTILSRVREAVAPEEQAAMADCRRRRDGLADRIDELRARREAIEDRLRPRVDEQIEEHQSRIEDEERVVELGTNGELASICDTLAEHDELDAELQDLYDRRQELETELSNLRHRREHSASGTSSDRAIPVTELDRNCPACGVTVPEQEARRRADDGACPVCSRATSAVREGLPTPTDLAGGEATGSEPADDATDATDLDAEIADREAELEEIDEEIEAVQSRQPSLAALDERLRRRLERHERDVEVVVADARARVDNHEAEIESLRERRQALDDEASRIAERLPELEREHADAEERYADLQATARDRVAEFARRWTETFRDLSPTLGMEVGFRGDEGVVLPGDPTRTYGEGDNLSDAERLLVNLSFGITLHETLDDRVALDTFVLDDPFVHLDETVTSEVSSYIEEDNDRQYVFTASDPSVGTAAVEILEIEQTPMKTELPDFVDEAAD